MLLILQSIKPLNNNIIYTLMIKNLDFLQTKHNNINQIRQVLKMSLKRQRTGFANINKKNNKYKRKFSNKFHLTLKINANANSKVNKHLLLKQLLHVIKMKKTMKI